MTSWSDNPPVQIDRTVDLAGGDEATVSRIAIGSHTGTHMDAPSHFVASGATMDEMPLEATIGPAQVIEITHPVAISVEELRPHTITVGERLHLKTLNSHRAWGEREFMEDFVYLSTEAAHWMADRRVRALGVDYLSVGGFHENGPEVHRVLLGRSIWIMEGLDLSAGTFTIRCFTGLTTLTCAAVVWLVPALRLHVGS